MYYQEGIVHNGRVLFSANELRCKGSGKLILAPGFAEKLLELRLALDDSMILNSCCRSKTHNQNVGGHPRSLHVCDFPFWPTNGTCAIDVRTTHRSPEYRERLVATARKLGWSIGFHPNFIHLDRRTDYTNRPRAEFKY